MFWQTKDEQTRLYCEHCLQYWTEEQYMEPLKLYEKPGFGKFFMAQSLTVIDKDPRALPPDVPDDDLLPLWIEEETPRLKSLTEPEMRKEWATRQQAMIDERNFRKKNKKRTIYG